MTFDEISSFGAQCIFGEAEPSESNVFIILHLLSIFGIEGAPSTAHLEDQHTKRPEIYHCSVACLIQQDFRSQVLGGTAEGIGGLIFRKIGLGKAEIAKRYVTIGIELQSARSKCSSL